MNRQSFQLTFLYSGGFITLFFSLLFSILWGYNFIYFTISCLFNIILTYTHIKHIEYNISLKNVNLIVLSSVLKLILITLFFVIIVYISDRKIITLFLISFGLLIAPITIRVVSYCKT